MKKLRIIVIVILFISFFGCARTRTRIPPKRYSASELIKIIEQNTAKIPSIRCKGGNLTIKLPKDEGGEKIDFDGLVVLYKPAKKFYLSGTILGKVLLIIGSNEKRFWIEILKEPTRLYWGKWKDIEIKTNLAGALIEAMGYIKPISANYIGPFLQIRKTCNALMYGKLNDKGEWYFAKEIQLSRYEPVVIKKIIYFDTDNTPLLIINLSNHVKLNSGAYIAGNIEVIFPEKQSYVKANLGHIEEQDTLPASAFIFPDTEFFDKVYKIK